MKPQTTDYEQRAQAFLDKHGIKFKATLSDTKQAPWAGRYNNGHHYRVTLSKQAHGRSFDQQAKFLTFDFWGSIADAMQGKHVTPYDVLACLSSDVH